MEENSLLDQQVIGWKVVKDKWVLNENVVSILRMMYPDFRLVKGVFDIYPDDCFIYVGKVEYINSVKNKPNPHIIVASSGIDLLDKKVLLQYVYSYLGRSVPKYFEDRKLLELWDDETFYYNLKFILLLGKVPDSELKKNSMFTDIISNFSNPLELISKYFEALSSDTFEYSFKSIEKGLVTYINNCRHMTDFNSKGAGSYISREVFLGTYDKNVSTAVYNLLDSEVDLPELRLLNFIIDIIGSIKRV